MTMRIADEKLIPTRYSLLSRLQNWDDQESWKQFFDSYWRLIYGVALNSGLSEAEAQDVVQETVISVAKDIQKFKRDRTLGSFKGWLRNIIRWRIGDQLRKRLPAADENPAEAGQSSSELENLEDSTSASLEAIWEEEWRANLLEAAMDRVKRQVKEEQFQLFEFYVAKKWPVDKVAKTFGVTTGRVYLAKHRVGAVLKKEIQRLEKNLV